MICRNCNTELELNATTCPICGTKVEADEMLPKSVALNNNQPTVSTTMNRKRPGKIVRIAIALTTGAILIFVILLFLITRHQPDKDSGSIFYIKNDTIYGTLLDSIAPMEIVTQPEIKQYRPWSMLDLFSLQVSEDGRKVFYPTEINLNSPTYSSDLYCYDLASGNPSKKIDSEINNYEINPNGSEIYYLKNKNLYISNRSKAEMFAEGVEDFYVSRKGDLLMYHSSHGGWFLCKNKKVITELDNINLQYVSEDLNIIYYLQGYDLYLLKDGKDSRKIIPGGVSSIINIYGDGSLYYLKQNQAKTSDYVNDDMAASDANMTEPKESDYPDHQSFTDAQANYAAKIARDEVRQTLKKSDSVIDGMFSLYYYSNGQSTKISDNCTNEWTYHEESSYLNFIATYHRNDRPLMVYTQPKISKINLSEVTSYSDIYNNIKNTIASKQGEQYVCSGSKVLKKLTDVNVSRIVYDWPNSKIYFSTEQKNSTSTCDLYYVTIDGDKISEGKLYAKDVILPSWPEDFVIGDAVIYFKNLNEDNYTADFYINNSMVDSNVSNWVWKIGNTDSFTYERYSDKGDDTCTLNLYKDGKAIKIADNVLIDHFHIYDEDRIAYMVKDQTNAQLYLYNDRTQKSQFVDTDVYDIIPPLGNRNYINTRPTAYE